VSARSALPADKESLWERVATRAKQQQQQQQLLNIHLTFVKKVSITISLSD